MSSSPSFAAVSSSLSLLRPHDHAAVLATLKTFCDDQRNDVMKPLSAYPLPPGALVDVLRLIGKPPSPSSSVQEQIDSYLHWFEANKDAVDTANSTLAMINEVLTTHGLHSLGWRGDLNNSTLSYSVLNFTHRKLAVSKYLLRKASPELLRDIVVRQVADILSPSDGITKAVELGWKNLPRPPQVVSRTERRWILECPDCHKCSYYNVLTNRVRRLVCSVDRKRMKISRNPEFAKDTVVMTGRKRTRREEEDIDSDDSCGHPGETRSYWDEAMAMGKAGLLG